MLTPWDPLPNHGFCQANICSHWENACTLAGTFQSHSLKLSQVSKCLIAFSYITQTADIIHSYLLQHSFLICVTFGHKLSDILFIRFNINYSLKITLRLQNCKHILVKMPIYPFCFQFRCLVYYFLLPAQNFISEFYIMPHDYVYLEDRDQSGVLLISLLFPYLTKFLLLALCAEALFSSNLSTSFSFLLQLLYLNYFPYSSSPILPLQISLMQQPYSSPPFFSQH